MGFAEGHGGWVGWTPLAGGDAWGAMTITGHRTERQPARSEPDGGARPRVGCDPAEGIGSMTHLIEEMSTHVYIMSCVVDIPRILAAWEGAIPLFRHRQRLYPRCEDAVERLDPFEQPAVLVGTLVPISEVCRKAPVDLPLLDASGVVPFHLVAELVLLFYIVSVGMEQIEVVIGILAGDHEFCPQFVSAIL